MKQYKVFYGSVWVGTVAASNSKRAQHKAARLYPSLVGRLTVQEYTL